MTGRYAGAGGPGRPRPVALIVLDGWGLDPRVEHNAVRLAHTPNVDAWWEAWPRATLSASGEDVGLLAGQIGNSNVGHLNLGAGRIVWQDMSRISQAIADGSFFENPALSAAMDRCAGGRGPALHLLCLVSDAGVHSHLDHLRACIRMAARRGADRLVVHAFTDGRDVPPGTAAGYLAEVEAALAGACPGGVRARIGTVMGRFWAMDRDRRWDRTAAAWRALVLAEGERAPSAREAVAAAGARGETDEFIRPTVIVPPGGEPAPVRVSDSVVLVNFRADRARQLAAALVLDDFAGFERPGGRPPIHCTGMTEIDPTLDVPAAFPPAYLKETLGEVLAGAGLHQCRIAETEKYAHVTYFFNGGDERALPGEDRLLIPSPKVATYDVVPEMSAAPVTGEAVRRVRSGNYDFLLVNYANPDMVGHTGDLQAAIQACAAVDRLCGRLVEAVLEVGGAAVVTADHGNAEVMAEYETGRPHTAHTTSRVPFMVLDPRIRGARCRDGILADVAPTVLQLMGIAPPQAMTGRPLLDPTGGETPCISGA